MKDLLDGKIINKLTFRHILLLISGLAIAFSAFLTWLSYNNLGYVESLTGIDLYQKYAVFPETPALPLIGATLFIGTLIISQLREAAAATRYSKYTALSLIFLTLILSVETAIRLQLFIKDQIGIDFFNNSGCGWYFAIGGAIISLVAIVLPHRKKKEQ